MPPLLTGLASSEGEVTQPLKDFCAARARGGVGLIITEGSNIHLAGRAYANGLCIADDRFIPGLSELAQAIHRHGGKAALQLQHYGRRASARISGLQPVAPSEMANGAGDTTHALTVVEIDKVAQCFAAAARRAKEAGFDGVEIGMTAEALIGNFLSRAYNRRDDAYGGDLVNRCRFMVQVITAVREMVGTDYPVWCRLDGKQDDAIADGITLDEAKGIARIAEKAGVQAIHVYTGSAGAPIPIAERPLSGPHLVPLAEAIKHVVAVPIIAAGAITPEDGEAILEAEKADLVAIGKALVADPELPNKVASDRLDEIRPCIKCLNCVNTVIHEGRSIQCSVNAQAGREGESLLEPARQPRRILVVGGGPAGMEAARVAALRGHRVTLYDKSTVQGGHLRVASVPPDTQAIARLVRYLENSLRQPNITIRLGESMTASELDRVRPEAIILATGAEPIVPALPGVNGKNVAGATEVLAGQGDIGQTVVVVGGGLVGCETALYLAGRKRQVTVLEMLPEIARDALAPVRPALLARMEKAKIRIEVGVTVQAITPHGVTAVRNGQALALDANTIVIAVGLRSNQSLAASLAGKTVETHVAGDCVKPRRIADAIREGFSAGCLV